MKKNTEINEIHFYAILLAAGKGSRLENASVKKQFITYQGAPLWWQSVKTFYASPHIKGIILVFPSDDEEFEAACEEAKKLHIKNNLGIPFIYARGGEKRHDSVFSGLQALPSSCSHVLIHDSARPFFSAHLIHNLVSPFKSPQNQNFHALIPAISVTDTIKIIHSSNTTQTIAQAQAKSLTGKLPTHTIPAHESLTKTLHPEILLNQEVLTTNMNEACENYEKVEKTLERQSLRAVQTPQAFSVKELIEAHKKMHAQNINDKQKKRELTDDAMLMEYAGHTVYITQGEANNIKITHAKDLDLLQTSTQQIPCSGYGYDVHRFGGDRPFVLGGISIPTPLQIKAHSDGDVLLHALMDALLSCMCLGDIGTHFPDSDQKYHNISSSLLLDHVMDLWKQSSLTLCHVDLTIITQKPQITPFAKEITKNIARLLSINPTYINVKATTEEKLGFTGKGLGIKAVALVSALKIIED